MRLGGKDGRGGFFLAVFGLDAQAIHWFSGVLWMLKILAQSERLGHEGVQVGWRSANPHT